MTKVVTVASTATAGLTQRKPQGQEEGNPEEYTGAGFTAVESTVVLRMTTLT
jgi:hypothetical protein